MSRIDQSGASIGCSVVEEGGGVTANGCEVCFGGHEHVLKVALW